MRLPRKWLLGLSLMAIAPGVAQAGPLDFLKGTRTERAQTADAPRSNAAVAQEIAKRLKEARLAGYDIDIEYKSGVATLNGKIKDRAQRARASQLVQAVAEVQSVDNRLQLIEQAPAQTSAIQQVQYQQSTRSNQAVAQDIANALTRAGLTNYDIEIRYKAGVASLIGAVDQPAQAAKAQMVVQQVSGVQAVMNRLTVDGQLAMQGPGMQGPQMQGPRMQGPQMQHPMMPGPQMQGPVYPAGAQVQNPAPYAPMPAQGAAPQMQGGPGYAPGMPQQPPGPIAQAGHQVYNQPNLPNYAWPSYAAHDNYAGVTYPSQYDASAFPYIGPFYPYPQVPLGWRSAQLVWDDGYWNLKFDDRTDRWWWFLNPENWHGRE